MADDSANPDRQSLGRVLREFREEAGLTQKELAARSKTDDTYISRVEHGRIDVGWSTLLRLLRAATKDLRQLADAIERDASRS
jgi:transcriptional regulator with XRE-family HTH domain